MNVVDLHKQLSQMIDNGKGDHEVVHVMGNGQERSFCGFEVVSAGSFDLPQGAARKAGTSRMIADREKPRIRLFTTSPF